METEEKSEKPQPETKVMMIELGDYSLKLLSEANGMTLLVSEIGQVFWVKKTKNGEKLIPLNRGKGQETLMSGSWTDEEAEEIMKKDNEYWKKIKTD